MEPEPAIPAGGIRALRTPAEVAAAVAESYAHPIVIYKHSVTCGRSQMALEEIQELLAARRNVTVFQVTVQSAAAASAEVASSLQVRHESPQAIVVSAGAVRWHGSHWRVNRDHLGQALDAAGGGARP